jgi:DNA-binding transcriptional LysR family regulator
MRMALTDLRVFLHACESGSMTEAGVRSHLTLAAVSARIRALEQGSGVQLLRRHARGVSPTAAGMTLARHARAVLQQLEVLERDLALATGSEAVPQTVLLANSSALARPMAGVLAAILEDEPAAHVVMRESGSEVTVHAVRTGAADLGIISDAVAADGLALHELEDDPLVLVAPAGHALAHGGPRSFCELIAHDWIAWGETSALHTHLLLHALRAGATIRVRAAIAAVGAALELVGRGAGISVLPAAVVAATPLTRPVAVVDLEEDWALRKLILCHRPAAAGSRVERLARLVRSAWPRQQARVD